MRLWGWWRKEENANDPGHNPESPTENTAPALLEDLQPAVEDAVEPTAKLRNLATPSVSDTVKSLTLDDFKNVNAMPCFRQAILTGLGIGGVAGSVIFLARRTPGKAANWAMGGFLLGSTVSWEQCRMRRRQGKQNVAAARQAFRSKEKDAGPPHDTN